MERKMNQEIRNNRAAMFMGPCPFASASAPLWLLGSRCGST